MQIPLAPLPPPGTAIPDSAPALWTTALSLYLQLPTSQFNPSDASLIAFIHSYLLHPPPAHKPLTRAVTLILHRILTSPSPPPSLTTHTFLRALSTTLPRSRVLRTIIDEERVWRHYEDAVNKLKRSVVSSRGTDADVDVVSLFRFCARAAETFLAGDEWVDVVVERGLVREFKGAVVAVAQGGGVRKGNWSMVCDVVYELVARAGNPKGGEKEGGFLKMLVEGTGVVAGMRRVAEGTEEEGRVEGVVRALERFGKVKRRKEKGKGKGKGKEKEKMVDDVEERRKVEVVRDLFPELGSGFVRRCLDAMDNDVERVTGALLEDALPPHLKTADRSEEYIPPDTAYPPPRQLDHPTRHNKYDNDALDRLDPSTLSRVHIGRKNASLTADVLLTSGRASKSSILSALAAFDSDDDERDDTYDLADVGGAVDTTGDEDIQRRVVVPVDEEDPADRILWEAYRRDPDVFSRTAEVRRSAARKDLREKTAKTDEALEGWKIMLERDPKRVRMLERRYDDVGGGGQNRIESTRWAPPAEGEEDGGRGRGRGRGRGGGRGRGRGRGNVAGPSGEKDTQVARQRKEQNKGHRDQRMKKMARGGAFPSDS